jgi:hypothetical protein
MSCVRNRAAFLCVVATATLLACTREEPPGATRSEAAEPALIAASASASARAGAGGGKREAELGGVEDNLPFVPAGKKLASVAWRTWVYTDTGSQRTRFGYLRAGAAVERREPVILNGGCAGGWYRINPRGFVCIGKGATLDLNDPLLKNASVRPIRGQGFPYLYALAGDSPPHLYFRFATRAQVSAIEGDATFSRAIAWRERIKAQGLLPVLEAASTPDAAWLEQKVILKPYGVAQRLHYSVHAGRAAPDSGFAVARVFEHDGRSYGLTTEHDLIALDRTRVVKPSSFSGVELGPDQALPVAFALSHGARRHDLDVESDQLHAGAELPHRAALKLTGKRRGAFWETHDGFWVLLDGMRVIQPRTSFPSFATGDRKWIDISINQQALVAYSGKKPVYATLVSTGRSGLADPEKTDATARGTFMIYQKDVSSTMDGEEDRSDGYALQDVPFVQYFHKGYALHGAYWHDEFGKMRSHGCVNLAPRDAAWLFEWTDPNVPPDWHGVLNKQRGTVVFIRP